MPLNSNNSDFYVISRFSLFSDIHFHENLLILQTKYFASEYTYYVLPFFL